MWLMGKYRVAQVGVGNRGTIHLEAFLELSDRFELVGLCDLDSAKLRQRIEEKGLDVPGYADAEEMLDETRPDVFCFVTSPTTSRLMFVELGVKYGVRAVAMEKPMATSLAEAQGIARLCREHGIKGVVSHQQKYLTSLQKVKETVDAGRIGEVTLITASCQGWLSQLGTHYVDYVLWINGGVRAEWVVGHVHGRELLADSHPSPNYTMGQIGLENGVRAFVEFGKLSARHMGKEKFWTDNRLTVHGTKGYAWGDTDGLWSALVDGEIIGDQGPDWSTQERSRLQPLYLADLADWLDDDERVHPCNVEISYHGYEIMEALCIGAMDNVRVDLPLDAHQGYDMFERMRRELPGCPERMKGEG